MKKIQGYILRKVSLLVVRNEESLKNLNEYGVKNAICTVDSAHAIVNNLDLNKKIEQTQKRLFIHIDPSCISKQEKLIGPINIFLSRHPEYEVYLGTDQKNKKEDELKNYLNQIHCRYKKIIPYNYPTQLCTELNKMDFIITPKLHVGIVGVTLSKSVVSFSIHSEKIKRFYNQLNENHRTLSINNFNEKQALDILEEYHDKKIILDKNILQLSYKNFEFVKKFINELEQKRKVEKRLL